MLVVKEARIESLQMTRADAGEWKPQGEYVLVGSTGKIMARQLFNSGYNKCIEVKPSASTQKHLDAFMAAFQADLNAVIGFEGDTQ
jgi:hypothetical protein